MNINVIFVLCTLFLLFSTASAMNNNKSEIFIELVMQNKTILRGTQCILSISDEKSIKEAKSSLRRFKNELHGNHVRIFWGPGTGLTSSEWEKLKPNPPPEFPDCYFWESEAGQIFKKRWLDFFQETGLYVIINMDAGNKFGISKFIRPASNAFWTNVWTDDTLRKKVIDNFVSKVTFLKDCPAVIGYDLVNEPIPPGSYEAKKDGIWAGWQWSDEKATEAGAYADTLARLYNQLITAIRSVDKKNIIILEPGPFGSSAGFPGLLSVIDDDRLIFSYHHYAPHVFCAANEKAWIKADISMVKEAPKYPNPDKYRDTPEESFLRAEEFHRAREEAKKHPCVIFIGEFGTTRFGDIASQKNWYSETLGRFEKNKWHWAYFLYPACAEVNWMCFSPFGPEGENVNIEKEFEYKNQFFKDKEVREIISKRMNTYRESFKLVLEYMKRNE